MSRRNHPLGVGFIILPMGMLVDREFIALPAAARVICFAICKQHRHAGKGIESNNGKIPYGCAAGAKAARVSLKHASRMLNLLWNTGLLNQRKAGEMRAHPAARGLAAEWEITIFPMYGRTARKRYSSNRKLHIEHRLVESRAYQRLTNTAKLILIEMMRRFDGGNNGSLLFGGKEGAAAGFTPRMTERALKQIEAERFIVQTAAAVPQKSRPRRWRLTMFKTGRKNPTMNFLEASSERQERDMGDAKIANNVTLVTLRAFLLGCAQNGLIPPYGQQIRQNPSDLAATAGPNLSVSHVNPIEAIPAPAVPGSPSSNAAAARPSMLSPRPRKSLPWNKPVTNGKIAISTENTAIPERRATKARTARGHR